MQPLPDGVRVYALRTHRDERGEFTETYRAEWPDAIEAVQWNVVKSCAGVLRGVHVHRKHADHLVVARGRATIGLADLRAGSRTHGLAATVEMSADSMAALVIPPGVAHGFYFHEPSLHIYAVTHYFSPDDELGCHWRDPQLGIAWPCSDAVLSPRDAALPTLAELLQRL